VSAISGLGNAAGVQRILEMRQQIIERSQLLQQVHAAPAETAAPAAGGGFADSLKQALDGVAATQRKAETLAEAYERGEVTDVAQVMLARQEAGLAFEGTLQVRNRLLNAYQDIMRMGV
jgi:flagellar hook-basal body complex protein FliE